MDELLTREGFLDQKPDYSPFLVHLTRDDVEFSAKDVLQQILDDKELRACSFTYCFFGKDLSAKDESLQGKFKVVCFTETPLNQIDMLLKRVEGKSIDLQPYGLVFKKEYVRRAGGNPVLYMSKDLARLLWPLYNKGAKEQFSDKENSLLALVSKCDEDFDFSWEREWRIVGNLEFNFNGIYCGLCLEKDISYFEKRYPVIFIDPHWGIYKILDKLVNLSKKR